MSHLPRKALFASALIAAAVLGAPVAAQASSIYPPSDACAVTPATSTPSGVLTFSCDDGTFSANEAVKVTITGESGDDVAWGMVKFAIATGSTDTTSGANGELAPLRITLPANATGVYNIAAVSATSAGGAASATVSTGGSGLPSTGGDATAVAIWTGAGLLAVAAGAVTVAAVRRRARHT
ncbi:LPXTG cell wall anchor domain-containing protein [Microbacterium sp. W1N]|uniref:LPXTG cell wall anchor domain-containing protein n=1 Tax=Microbacterium festucae TaxID=2977531 RepID=UPI0021C1F0EB|nr:LPXTG cell wall anchor domain-containing protein [Microbacterium festucae]MCT9819064.1 LPXTG cell wall anchor domain-containing protein [Microbacterium festucae]